MSLLLNIELVLITDVFIFFSQSYFLSLHLSSRFEFLEILARIKVPKIKAWRDTRIPCKNKDLVVRNKRLLYSKNEIPMSSYFTELKSFEQDRRRTFNELLETNLHIPGRIIHLVNAIDCGGKKYLPYWESSKSLREIDLSIEVMVSSVVFLMHDFVQSLNCRYALILSERA